MNRTRLLRTGFKAAASTLLLGYVFAKAGWSEVWTAIAGANVWLLLAYLGLSLGSIVVSAWKWQVLCRARGLPSSFGRLLVLYLVGLFFNHLLPTSVGGDVVRGLELSRAGSRRSEALASVFVERFTGLTTLLVLALLALVLDPRYLADWRVAVAVGSLVAGYGAGTVLVLSPWAVGVVRRFAPFAWVRRGLDKVKAFQEAIHAYRENRAALVQAVALSFLFYGVAVATTWVGIRMLGGVADLVDVSLAVPVMLTLFMIPLTLGGIGLQEWAYMFVLGLVGVPAPLGAALGLVFRAKTVLFGVLGGILYAATFSTRDPELGGISQEPEAPR